MSIEYLNKIYSDPKLLSFLRENSFWYKFLNRGGSFLVFENAMKEKYELRFSDKFSKFQMGASLLKAFMDETK